MYGPVLGKYNYANNCNHFIYINIQIGSLFMSGSIYNLAMINLLKLLFKSKQGTLQTEEFRIFVCTIVQLS